MWHAGPISLAYSKTTLQTAHKVRLFLVTTKKIGHPRTPYRVLPSLFWLLMVSLQLFPTLSSLSCSRTTPEFTYEQPNIEVPRIQQNFIIEVHGWL